MHTFKYNGTDPIEVPALQIHIHPGDTFEVPDGFEPRFEQDPLFAASRTKSPDVTVDAAVTGSIPTVDPAAPAA